AAPTGSSLTFTMLGTPFAFGAIALDLGFGPGLMLPGTIGTYLLGPTPVVQQLLLGSNGEGSLTIGIPTTITAIDLVAQAAELSTSPAPSVFLLSDAATAGVTTTTVGSIPGGGSEATGSYDDENHLYEVTLQFTGTPESGYFEFCNAKTGKCIRPDTGSLYSADLGVVIELTGILPLDWEGQVELYFVDSSGERHLVWKSYC
ncbi:MAG: hypothetical protein KDE27_29575, partial [Planctomycetes bacterium]|nr:hypothetical protein [Planctomycetota bacterium]